MDNQQLKELKYGLRQSEKRLLGLLQLKESECFKPNESIYVAMELNISTLEFSIKNQRFLIKNVERGLRRCKK